ncbi:MAG TPA: LysM peptidoglycan-binding domain-containing protein, partial [Sphingobacteriaceae bacterium]
KEEPAWKGFNAGNSNPSTHQVKAGETLDSIADYYQVDVRDVRAWNRLTGDNLRPGQILRLSGSKTFITYKVQPGDTLSTIARKFEGANEVEIRQTNGLTGESLRPGMVLRISQG